MEARSPSQSIAHANYIATAPIDSEAGPAARSRQHRKIDSAPYRSRTNSISSFHNEAVAGFEDDAKDVDWSPVSERNEVSSFASRRRGSVASSATSEWEVDANSRLTDLNIGESSDRLADIAKLAKISSAPGSVDRHRSTFCHVWLGQAYQTSTEGPCNVSRQALYASYGTVCEQHGIRPVNAASFGKAVKATFPSIKTRRLGVRGCSRYHYCGMRAATVREQQLLDHFSDIDKQRTMTHNRDRSDSSASSFSSSFGPDDADDDQDAEGEIDPDAPVLRHAASAPRLASPCTPYFPKQEPTDELDSRRRHSITSHSFDSPVPRGQPSLVRLANFPSLTEAIVMAPELSTQRVQSLWTEFELFCTTLINAAEGRRFDAVEQLIYRFYERHIAEPDKRQIFEHPVYATTSLRGEASVYDAVLASISKTVALPMPQPVFAALRHLVNDMERIVVKAAELLSPSTAGPKIELAARFAHLLGRQLGVIQLAQALTSILASQATCQQMATSLSQIDVEHLRNHCALALDNDVSRHLGGIFAECAGMLAERSLCQINSLESYVSWLDTTYDRIIAATRGGKSGAQSMLANTSFITVLFLQEVWGLRSMRAIALHVQPPETVHKSSRPAPLPLRPELMGYSGPSYLAVSPAEARFADSSTSASSFAGILSTVSPRTAQAFADAANFSSEAGQSLTAPIIIGGTGQTPTPMALTFADRWRTNEEEDRMDMRDFVTLFKVEEEEDALCA